jgi:threonine/homoserine/homoserine lactone efflux protein
MMLKAVGAWLSGTEAAVLLVVLGLATIGTGMLFLVSVAGYRRRRTTVYLLMTVALGLLVSRSLVGFGTAIGFVPMPAHHIIEHGSDFAVAALILYALYRSGPPAPAE